MLNVITSTLKHGNKTLYYEFTFTYLNLVRVPNFPNYNVSKSRRNFVNNLPIGKKRLQVAYIPSFSRHRLLTSFP